MTQALVEVWKKIIIGGDKSWVLFQNGTCVILMQPEPDLKQQAIDLLQEYGPVHAGSPSGDFSAIELVEHPGWVVTCHHPDILTYVAPAEFEEDEPEELAIGLLGRSKRDQDAADLGVLHIESQR